MTFETVIDVTIGQENVAIFNILEVKRFVTLAGEKAYLQADIFNSLSKNCQVNMYRSKAVRPHCIKSHINVTHKQDDHISTNGLNDKLVWLIMDIDLPDVIRLVERHIRDCTMCRRKNIYDIGESEQTKSKKRRRIDDSDDESDDSVLDSPNISNKKRGRDSDSDSDHDDEGPSCKKRRSVNEFTRTTRYGYQLDDFVADDSD